jgi:hypothetical protein
VECREHGWQNTNLVTRYDRRAKPRDVPDLFLCIACQRAATPASAANAIEIGPETTPSE